jgi:hypothetical protein
VAAAGRTPGSRWFVNEPEHNSTVFVLALRCQECGRRWNDPAERWRVYFTSDEPPESASYCPECARREFDD